MTGTLSCSPSGTYSADWDLYHPTQGLKDVLWFDQTRSQIWDVYDWSITPARYSWRPEGAWDANGDPASQNQPSTDVRVGSGAAIYTSRSGSYVTITTSSSRYAYSVSQWIRWGNIRGTIQYYSASTGWTSFKYAYQDANGYYTYRLYAPTARSYRVFFPGTSSVWGSVSSASYR